ncbi:MAG: hypothetical protein KGV56_04235 [Gammaproteobacteria bacterium]|nr:hypothetical protein [Gammaproteobacteria bacterium]
MREIKFRFYCKQLEQYIRCDDLEIQEIVVLVQGKSHELNDIIVEQYTGLKDSKGVDIYEGDIIEYKHVFGEIWVVFYDVQEAAFILKMISNDNSRVDTFNFFKTMLFRDIENLDKQKVIGNIHENPELLEK